MGGAWPTTMGYGVTNVWADEMSNHSVDAFSHATQRATGWSPPQQVKTVRPIKVACRYCGAQPGQECTRWRRTKRGMVRQNRDSPHPDRKYDAKLATTALTALTINR